MSPLDIIPSEAQTDGTHAPKAQPASKIKSGENKVKDEIASATSRKTQPKEHNKKGSKFKALEMA